MLDKIKEAEGNELRLFTTREVAKMLNFHENTVRKLVKDGKIRSYQVSSRGDKRYTIEDVMSFLKYFQSGA